MNLSKLLPAEISSAELESGIKTITTRIVERVNPLSVFLFGSALRGPRSLGSDIDLCVVVSDGSDMSATRKALGVGPLSDLKVDILLYRESDFLRKSSVGGVCEIIFAEGRLLYGKEIRV